MEDLLKEYIRLGDEAMDKSEALLARTLTTPNDVKECYGLVQSANVWYQAAKLLNLKLKELNTAPQGQQAV